MSLRSNLWTTLSSSNRHFDEGRGVNWLRGARGGGMMNARDPCAPRRLIAARSQRERWSNTCL